MPRFKKTVFLLATFLTLHCSVHAKVIRTLGEISPAGTVSPLYGKIILINAKGQKKSPESVTSVFEGDTVRTEEDSFAELRLADGSLINLGDKSGFKLEEFHYESNMDQGKMKIRILSGIYRFTSGRMRADESQNIQILLPVGNVTVRNATLLGQIFGNRSVTILWKSPLKVESFEPVSVKSKENNIVYETTIEKQGFGCILEDEKFGPSNAIKIPEKDIAWIEYKLSPFSAQKKEADTVIKAPEFAIQAIVYDQEDLFQSRMVVVSGKLYKEGDIVEDHKILVIEPRNVTVKNMSTGETKNLKAASPSKTTPVKKVEEEKPVLESIFYDRRNSKNSFAYIKGNLYREGASVLGFKIMQIFKDRIKLKEEKNGRVSTLKLQFRSGGSQKGEIPLILHSISFDPMDETKSLATLNGVLYHKGESWENFKITKIFKNGVLLTDKKTKKQKKLVINKLLEFYDEKPNIEIQVILFNEQEKEKSQVAVKGKLYKAGELIDGYEVLDIQKSSIRVRKKGDIRWQTYVINNAPA